MAFVIDQNALLEDLFAKRALVYELHGNDDLFLLHLNSFVYRVMSEMGLVFLHEPVFVVLSELITNSLKACAKRVFFKKQGLDLNNVVDYEKGMTSFRSEVLEKWDSQGLQLRQHSFRVLLSATLTDAGLQVVIQNNVAVVAYERDRIEKRMNVALRGMDLSVNVAESIDISEGGGLGLLLSRLLLQNTGIGSENLKFLMNEHGTQMILFIPKQVSRPVVADHVSKKIIERIDTLPVFPDHVHRLVMLCESERADLSIITSHIVKDPVLAAQILKLAGSAGYVGNNKNLSLLEAVRIIGLNQVRSFLFVAGARTVLSSRLPKEKMEEVWSNSNRVSFFAGQLAKGNREVKETAIVAGLLSDLGRIIAYSFGDEDYHKLRRLTGRENIDVQTVIEETTLGISYAELGAMLGKKWNFPENILYTIQNQMRPLHVEESKIDFVYPVYLARCMADVLSAKQQFEFIEYRVLKMYDLVGREKFNARLAELEQRFRSQYEHVHS